MREATTPSSPSPVSLIETRRRFDRWRSSRPRGERTPAVLWAAAEELAGTHGVSKTSQVLQLDYYTMKDRLAEASADASIPTAAAQEFMEVALPACVATIPQCRLELRDHDGSTVRVDLSG